MRHVTIRRTIFPLLLLLVAMLAAPLLAQDPDRRLELLDLPGKWWKHPKVAEGLKLTAEQSGRIDLIFLEHRKTLIDLKARMEKQLMDFRELADRTDFRREEAVQLLDQVTATRSEMAHVKTSSAKPTTSPTTSAPGMMGRGKVPHG